MKEIIEKIVKVCEYEGIDPTLLFTNLFLRIEKVGARETYKELEALSTLDSKRSMFIQQLKIKDWVTKEISHYRYTFIDIDHLASYKNRLMLIEYKYIKENNNNNNSNNNNNNNTHPHHFLTKGQRITYRYLDKLLKAGSKLCTDAKYEGFYVIAMDNMDIDNANIILINGIEATREELKELLSFNQNKNRYPTLLD